MVLFCGRWASSSTDLLNQNIVYMLLGVVKKFQASNNQNINNRNVFTPYYYPVFLNKTFLNFNFSNGMIPFLPFQSPTQILLSLHA